MPPRMNPQTARSLLELGDQSADQSACAYLCYWLAFTSLASSAATQAGVRPHFGLNKNGTLRIKRAGTLKMAEVYPPVERAVLDAAFKKLSTRLKHRLITHESAHFFVERTPTWRGQRIAVDTFKQRLNGVLDMRCTLEARYPVWSPVNTEQYAAYLEITKSGKTSGKGQTALAKQLLDVLHTVYQNLLYAGSPGTDENALDVIRNAAALLKIIVESLI